MSHKQYFALIKRLDEINADVTSIKLKTVPEVGFIDTYDLMKLLLVSIRTVQRWRKSGRLPYSRIGGKYYFKADLILNSFKLNPNCPDDPVDKVEWKTKNQFLTGQNIQLMTTTRDATKIMEKARIVLPGNTIVKIGKILKKNGFERIRKGNNYSYMLRIVEAETVETGRRTLEDTEAQVSEQESNDRIIRLEENLFGLGKKDDLPF